MQPKTSDLMKPWSLFGTRNSTFDWWSIIHFGFYAFIASSLEALTRWCHALMGEQAGWIMELLKTEPKGEWYYHLFWFLPLTIGWEVFEHFAERRWPEKWAGKLEHWSNKWIGDQISNTAGLVFGIWVVWQ